MSVSPTPQQPRLSTLPEQKAKAAIKLLEQKILDEFGYRVNLGAEIEFVVKAKPQFNRANPLDVPHAKMETTVEDFTPQGWRPEAPADPAKRDPKMAYRDDVLFPDSPYICYSYLESQLAQRPPLYKYEAVISHRAIEKEERGMEHSRGVHLGDVIEATNKLILGEYPGDKLPSGPYFEHVKALRARTEATYLTPYIDHITSGLHINVSLSHPQYEPSPAAHEVLARAIKDTTLDGLFLLGTDEASMQRYEKRNRAKYVKNSGDYLENALPSASSNPYYATLLTLAGVYEGLSRMQGKTLPPAYAPEKPGLFHRGDSLHHVASTKEHVEEIFFRENNTLTRVLNTVQPGLGDDFRETIRTYPPGKEMRRVTIPGYSEGAAVS
jgi:hypothetical protein